MFLVGNKVQSRGLNSPNSLEAFAEAIFIEIKYVIKTDIRIHAGNYIYLLIVIMEMVEKVNRKLAIRISFEHRAKLITMVADKAVAFLKKNNLLAEDSHFDKIVGPVVEALSHISSNKKTINKRMATRDFKTDTITITNDLFAKIKEFFLSKKIQIDGQLIMKLIVQLVALISEYKSLGDDEKQLIIVNVVKRFVDELPNIYPEVDKEQLALYQEMVKHLPDLITNITKVLKGEYKLGDLKFSFVVENILVLFTAENIAKCQTLFSKCSCPCWKGNAELPATATVPTPAPAPASISTPVPVVTV